jgi:hypothetical protein
MEFLMAQPHSDANVACVMNVLKNSSTIRDVANQEFINKSEKHFSWLEEILQEIRTTLAR